MFQITIPKVELWDESNCEFVYRDEQTLTLVHSLVSLSKWERKWHKPFLGKSKKTDEETLDYIKCMTISDDVDPEVYKYITDENLEQIKKYIDDPMTATTFSDNTHCKKSQQIVTAEVIYSWMISLGVPVEFQEWHLNSLLALIRTHSAMTAPKKKMSRRDTISQTASLNAARRKQLNTKG